LTDPLFLCYDYTMNKKCEVYFILDEKSNAIKIGYASNLEKRFSGIQTGNPNPLVILHTIKCRSVDHASNLENDLHIQFDHLRGLGEWFEFDKNLFLDFFKNDFNFEPKQKRQPLTISTLFGEEILFDVKTHPRCFFYEHHVAQIKRSYEKSLNLTVPFRTMEYPTYGKKMLLPYSNEINRVFISTKKHEQILELKRFQMVELENSKINTIENNTVETFL